MTRVVVALLVASAVTLVASVAAWSVPAAGVVASGVLALAAVSQLEVGEPR